MSSDSSVLTVTFKTLLKKKKEKTFYFASITFTVFTCTSSCLNPPAQPLLDLIFTKHV